MNKLSIGQRIMADTDPVLKFIQILMFFVLVAVAAMQQTHLGTPQLQALLACCALVAMAVCQFSVKAETLIAANGLSLTTLVQALPDINDTMQQIHEYIKNPPIIPTLAQATENLQHAIVVDQAAVAQNSEAPVVELSATVKQPVKIPPVNKI